MKRYAITQFSTPGQIETVEFEKEEQSLLDLALITDFEPEEFDRISEIQVNTFIVFDQGKLVVERTA